jgi:hypothetical protein
MIDAQIVLIQSNLRFCSCGPNRAKAAEAGDTVGELKEVIWSGFYKAKVPGSVSVCEAVPGSWT